jgi:hypothetical protein
VDDCHFFEKWISHFITFIQAHEYNLNTTNYHLLVLDGQNSRVITNVVYKAKNMGLDLIILPSHTSLVL